MSQEGARENEEYTWINLSAREALSYKTKISTRDSRDKPEDSLKHTKGISDCLTGEMQCSFPLQTPFTAHRMLLTFRVEKEHCMQMWWKVANKLVTRWKTRQCVRNVATSFRQEDAQESSRGMQQQNAGRVRDPREVRPSKSSQPRSVRAFQQLRLVTLFPASREITQRRAASRNGWFGIAAESDPVSPLRASTAQRTPFLFWRHMQQRCPSAETHGTDAVHTWHAAPCFDRNRQPQTGSMQS